MLFCILLITLISGESATTKNISMSSSTDSVMAIKMVNLSHKEQLIVIDEDEYYYLPFGEYDITTNGCKELILPADPNVLLVSVSKYATETKKFSIYYEFINGMSPDYNISYSGENIYYTNYLERNALYKYNVETKENVNLLDESVNICCISNDERYFVLSINSEYFFFDTQNGVKTKLTTGEQYSFNARGELLFVAQNQDNDYEVHRYLNGISEVLFEGKDYAFDSSGNHIMVKSTYKNHTNSTVCKYTLYKNHNGSYTEVKSIEPGKNYSVSYLNDDLSVFYHGGTAIDIQTGMEKEGIGSICYKASNNTYIVDNINFYDPATGESYKIADVTSGSVHYNPDTGILTIVDNGYIARCKFTAEKSSAKYLLSFDGKNTWQSYKNGRWITVSKGRAPTEAEIGALGMTGDELNNITSAAYKKLYTNGTDILSVDIAIYMNSTSNKLTPVISKITVSTSENVTIRQMFSVRRETYNRSDYANVTSLFPVEDFKESSECYYLFHLGKDKLYTYKGNELVEIAETEEELFGNMEDTWIKFKQYAMSAKEVRNIPADVLTNLFVNSESTHTEFGVIYVLKGANNNANTVIFKIQANAKHINSAETIIEVMMNGGDKKIIDSRDFNTESIERFLSWLEDRQVGRGAIFYIFKNDNTQIFINYYMIDSINVYDVDNYTTEETDITEDADEQTAVVEE